MLKKYSKSPITRENYLIPQYNDKSALDRFLTRNKSKELVAVQGLGFVGTVMSLVVANSDVDSYAVVGVDKASVGSYWKIGDINNGKLPIVSSDPLVGEFFHKSKKRNNLYATYDTIAFAYASIIIVDINVCCI